MRSKFLKILVPAVVLAAALGSALLVQAAARSDAVMVVAAELADAGPSLEGFRYPAGVAVAGDRLYVADTGNHRVVEFDAAGKALRAIGQMGVIEPNGDPYGGLDRVIGADGETASYFTKDAEFDSTSSTLYVADTMNHRIHVIDDNTGGIVRTIGGFGSGPGQLMCPYGLSLDREGNLVVADTMAHRIVRLSPEGDFLGAWGTAGTRRGQFQFPHDTAIDTSGNVYVTDFANHRIQKFSHDGKLLASWGGHGSRNGEFDYPWGLAVDHRGLVWVSDMGNRRLQVFTPGGEFVMAYGGPRIFERPKGLSVDSRGDVWVADSGRNRVVRLRLTRSGEGKVPPERDRDASGRISG